MRAVGMFGTALLWLLVQVTQSAGQTGAATPAGPRPMTIAGWVEFGWLGNPPIRVKAKLDTGARTSSINAPVYREYVQDGKRLVSFQMINGTGHETDITAPLVRHARIRRAGTDIQERPVVRLNVCVAGVTSEVEFTITDRSGLNYLVLIGRSFLKDNILVDSGRTFLGSGLCKPG